MLVVTGPTAADMQLGWTVTNESSFLGSWSFPTTATDPAPLSYTPVADDTDVAIIQTDPATKHMINFRGTLNITTTQGSLVLRFAQAVSDPSNTSILTGSLLRLTKLD
jgi:hypothetical protein